MMVHIVTLVEKKQNPAAKLAAIQLEAASKLDTPTQQICDTISDRLKVLLVWKLVKPNILLMHL